VVFVAVGVVVVGLCVALVAILAVDPGPSAADVAMSYEQAWDHLDFESLWTLSGAELRDGLERDAFVEAKGAAYRRQDALRGLAADVVVDAVSEGRGFAVVHTRVALRDGGSAADTLQLAKRAGRWVVVAYQLAPNPAGA
jgi:hypothetical protein